MYYVLYDDIVIPCDEKTWLDFKQDPDRSLIARVYIDPGLTIQTGFIGRTIDGMPVLFATVVFTDCGDFPRYSETMQGAVRMHNMECQRLQHVVLRNQWGKFGED